VFLKIVFFIIKKDVSNHFAVIALLLKCQDRLPYLIIPAKGNFQILNLNIHQLHPLPAFLLFEVVVFDPGRQKQSLDLAIVFITEDAVALGPASRGLH
jgi:hypothetical protein